MNQSNEEAVRVANNKVRFYFHRQLNDEKYQQIFSDSDKEFQSSIGEAKAIEYFSAVRRKLGKVKRTELKGWDFNNENNQTLIAVFYETEFEMDKAREEFIWRIDGDKAFLFRYNVDSPTLVIK